LRFAEVDVVEGGGVDDGVELVFFEPLTKLHRIGNIQFITSCKREHLMPTFWQQLRQIVAKLS